MELKNKKILLTGGTGLVGTPLVELLLKAGAEVTCFTRKSRTADHPKLRYIHSDLRQLPQLGSERPVIEPVDYIIYIAANIPQLHETKETIFTAKENTLDPFLSFLEYYGHLAPKIIFTSTIDIYGYPDALNFSEDTPINPPTPYALAKYACEEYLRYYAKTEQKKYVILRFSQVYGPNEPFVRVIPFIIDAALHNKPFTMWGNPRNRRKFLYARDAARAVLSAVAYNKDGIFHIAGSQEIAIEEVVSTVEKITGKKIEVSHKNAENEQVHIIPSTKKAETELGFEPQTSFPDGMKEILKP
ncbi:MAG: UDP-glucose 4-epimerase [Candidatus Parcubacteria bacterium]|jgi:UDP-glucose 4-epimerase